MNTFLRSLCFLTVLAPLASAQSELDTARLEVHRGRVVMLNNGMAERTLRTGATETARGATHLELGIGSEARLSWPGRASLHIWGPSSVRWSVVEPPADAPEGTERSLQWTISDLAWCDLEVRKGHHRLELPGHWVAQIQPSAVYLRGLPAGPIELRLHAGQPVRLDWSGDASQARPPVLVNPGSSVRLERPRAALKDKSSQAQAWDRKADWPYRKPSDNAAQRAARVDLSNKTREQAPWPAPDAGRSARNGERATRGQVSPIIAAPQVELARDPLPVPPVQPADEPLPEPLPEPEPQPEPQPEVDNTPKRGEVPYKPAHWGGLEASELVSCGQFAVEDGPSVEVRMFDRGRHKVLVDAHAAAPIMVFTPSGDHRMHPGAVAVFEADGSLRMGFGKIEAVRAPKSRVPYADLFK